MYSEDKTFTIYQNNKRPYILWLMLSLILNLILIMALSFFWFKNKDLSIKLLLSEKTNQQINLRINNPKVNKLLMLNTKSLNKQVCYNKENNSLENCPNNRNLSR